MCLYGVTGCSGHVDRMHRSVHPELQWLSVDQTRPVTFSLHWNLTDVDQTLDLQSLVTC